MKYHVILWGADLGVFELIDWRFYERIGSDYVRPEPAFISPNSLLFPIASYSKKSQRNPSAKETS